MQYSKYLGLKILESGTPPLKEDVFIKIIKIISIEGTLKGLRLARVNLPETEKHVYDLLIMQTGMKLTEITGNLPPAFLFEKMIKGEVY